MALAKAYDFVIAGSGVCGLAAARYLLRACAASSAGGRQRSTARILVVSEHAPMAWSSALSTECYRDHWPSTHMRAFMRRSISLLDEFHGDARHGADAHTGGFAMHPRGYLYVTDKAEHVQQYITDASACHGAENVRVVSDATAGTARAATHTWTRGGSVDAATPRSMHPAGSDMTGADVYTSSTALCAAFPFLSDTCTAGMHARAAGWISAHTMGMCMYESARSSVHTETGEPAVKFVRGRVSRVHAPGGRVSGVTVCVDGRDAHVHCPAFVNASGPRLAATHACTDLSPSSSASSPAACPPPGLRVLSEVHAKVMFKDTLRAVPRTAPMTIVDCPTRLRMSQEELEDIQAVDPSLAQRLGGVLPAGAHFRPYGGDGSDAVLMLWECWHHQLRAAEPPLDDITEQLDHDWYPEVALRGLARIVPDLALYFDPKYVSPSGRVASLDARVKSTVDGGYYTKTPENLPLIGPVAADAAHTQPIHGAFACGAVSGYGIMAAHAAGELLAMHATGATQLPDYARWMSPMRYGDPAFMGPGGIREQILAAGDGQL